MQTDPTIRQIIKRRIRWLILMGAAGWILLMTTTPRLRAAGPVFPPLMVAGFVLFAAAIFLAQLIKCPNCSARLGAIATKIGFSWGYTQRVRFCPYCGIDIDQPVPHKLIS